MRDLLLSGVAAVALSISLFIETSSWWIRVGATKQNFGHYISRSNIYLYGGRFFYFIFGVFLALQIERGVEPSSISLTLALSFAMASCWQFFLINSFFRRYIIIFLSICLGLRPPMFEPQNENAILQSDRSLFLGTFIASLSFSFGLSVPPLLAAIFIANRLVISNIGQLINAFGMIVVLFFVDQKLYRAFDDGNLYCNLIAYSKARLCAFLLISVIFLAISRATINV